MINKGIPVFTAIIILLSPGIGISYAAIKEIDINQSSDTVQIIDSDPSSLAEKKIDEQKSNDVENKTGTDQQNKQSEAALRKQLARDTIALLVFKFSNMTGSKEHDDLCDKISQELAKGLSRNKKFMIIETGLYLNLLKSKQYTAYLKEFKKNLETNVIDLMIGGQVVKKDTYDIIECYIFITRLRQIKKIHVRGKSLQQSAKMMIDELIEKSTEEIEDQISKKQWQIQRQLFNIPKTAFTTLAVYYGFWFVLEPGKNGFPHRYAGMLTILLNWELAQILTLKTLEEASGLALFLSIDIGESAAMVNVIDKSSSIDGVKYHFGMWGIAAGPMYKFRVVDCFSINIATGYGPVYSQSALWSDYNGAINIIVPPRHIDARWDHYLNALIMFNGIVYPNCEISIAYSYKLIIYPHRYLHSLVAKMGLGVKF